VTFDTLQSKFKYQNLDDTALTVHRLHRRLCRHEGLGLAAPRSNWPRHRLV